MLISSCNSINEKNTKKSSSVFINSFISNSLKTSTFIDSVRTHSNSSEPSTSNKNGHQHNSETIIEHYYHENGSLTQWDQSMAIYDDKVFLFLDTTAENASEAGYSFVVLDLITKEILFKGQTPTRNCHNNNAQFLDVFFSSEDKYPLLLLSRGDYPSSPDAEKCYVVRIIETNNSFQLEIIKTISCTLEQAKFNGSWVTDRCGNLFLYTMTLGDWRVPESDGNKFIVYRFDMFDPIDGSNLVLTNDDVKGFSTFDYCIFQGGDSLNGKLYLPIGGYTKINGIREPNVRNIVAIVDPICGIVEDTIDSDVLENEGVSYYKGKLYVASKDGSGTAQTRTPTFKIQSFTL